MTKIVLNGRTVEADNRTPHALNVYDLLAV